MKKCPSCGVLEGTGPHDHSCTLAGQEFWVALADLVDTAIKRVSSSTTSRTVSANELADIGAPMLWCSALIAIAAHADRQQFLGIVGQLYDKAQVAYATGRPMQDLLNPDQTRGEA